LKNVFGPERKDDGCVDCQEGQVYESSLENGTKCRSLLGAKDGINTII
jgi:hypothetical protein